MTELILFSFATVGLTNILVYGKILDGWRAMVRAHVPPKVYEVLECYQCTGFWSGIVAGMAIVGTSLPTVLMCGFASSFLAEYASVIREYLEANSMVDLPTYHPDEANDDRP